MSGGSAKREREEKRECKREAEKRESKRAHVVVPGVETDAPVVCAIDFGTACTGVAFAFTSKPGNNLSTACLFDMHSLKHSTLAVTSACTRDHQGAGAWRTRSG